MLAILAGFATCSRPASFPMTASRARALALCAASRKRRLCRVSGGRTNRTADGGIGSKREAVELVGSGHDFGRRRLKAALCEVQALRLLLHENTAWLTVHANRYATNKGEPAHGPRLAVIGNGAMERTNVA